MRLIMFLVMFGFVATVHAAKVGGTLTQSLPADPTTLHPINSSDTYSRAIHDYTFDSLLTNDLTTYEFKPALAEKYEGSKDGTEWVFTLREGAKFHDGTPVTAEDVKFSFDVIWNDKFQTAQKRPYYENIGSPEIVDARHIKFKFKKKYVLNLQYVATTLIVPKHVYQDADNKKLNKTIVGSGPYKLETYDRGTRIVLKRNSDWYGFKTPQYKDMWNFENLVFKIVKEENVELEMFKKGDLDFIGLTPEQYMLKTTGPEWGTKLLKIKTENKAPKGYGFVAWNLKNDLFKDRDVRIALAHLLNRKLMNEKFLFNMSLLMPGPVYPLSDYHSTNVKPIEFDPKKAAMLLKKAGWSDSDKNGILDKQINGQKKEFSFTLLNPNEDFNKYLTIYKEDAKKAGIEIQLKNIEWNSFMKLVDERNFDSVTLGWGNGDVEWEEKQLWHTDSIANAGSNFVSYSNPEVDKLIDQARELLDRKKRLPLVRKIDELIAADQPYAFLFTAKFVRYGVSAKIKRPKDTYNYAIGARYWWVE